MPDVLLGSPVIPVVGAGEFTSGAGLLDAWQYRCRVSGVLDEIVMGLGPTANTGVTAVHFAVFADSAGTPGSRLTTPKVVSGQPTAGVELRSGTGIGLTVVRDQLYWLCYLPIGNLLHYLTGGPDNTGQGQSDIQEKWDSGPDSTIPATWPGTLSGNAGSQGMRLYGIGAPDAITGGSKPHSGARLTPYPVGL